MTWSFSTKNISNCNGLNNSERFRHVKFIIFLKHKFESGLQYVMLICTERSCKSWTSPTAQHHNATRSCSLQILDGTVILLKKRRYCLEHWRTYRTVESICYKPETIYNIVCQLCYKPETIFNIVCQLCISIRKKRKWTTSIINESKSKQ